MANYTKSEIEAFRRKDLLYSRQSAAKATSVVFEGMGIGVEEFKKYSDEMFAWIQQDQLAEVKIPMPATTPKKESVGGSLPTPTPEQKKVLDAILYDLPSKDIPWDWDFVCKQVLKYSTDIAGASSPTYPKSMGSVDKIVEWLKT